MVEQERKIPLKVRQDYVAKMPFISRLKEAVPCEGWHASSRGKRPCKNLAHWKYEHSGDKRAFRRGEVHNYCWSHLISRGIWGDMPDEMRAHRWIDKHPPPWSIEVSDTVIGWTEFHD